MGDLAGRRDLREGGGGGVEVDGVGRGLPRGEVGRGGVGLEGGPEDPVPPLLHEGRRLGDGRLQGLGPVLIAHPVGRVDVAAHVLDGCGDGRDLAIGLGGDFLDLAAGLADGGVGGEESGGVELGHRKLRCAPPSLITSFGVARGWVDGTVTLPVVSDSLD